MLHRFSALMQLSCLATVHLREQSNVLILGKQLEGSIQLTKDSQVVLLIKNLRATAGVVRDTALIPGSGGSPEGGLDPTQVFLPGESHAQRSLAGYHP